MNVKVLGSEGRDFRDYVNISSFYSLDGNMYICDIGIIKDIPSKCLYSY